MSFKLTLRTRFMAAILLVVAILSIAFFAAVGLFVELMEVELLDRTVAHELQKFAERYQAQPDVAPPDAGDLKGYIVGDGNLGQLPESLRDLPPGLHDDIYVQGREQLVGRRDVGSTRLYLTMDVEPIDELETRIVSLAVISSVFGVGLALLVSFILARIVTEPVSRLAKRVADLHPGRRGLRLQSGIRDPEVGQIAAALDHYLERADAFIQREQAFTEDASHELRTPLATILSATQLLSEQPDLPVQAQERVARIARAGARTQSLIEALLFLAREDAGEPPETCAMDEVVQETEEMLRDQAAQSGVTLIVHAQAVLVRAPAGMAACVVSNLVLNALQFTQEGGRVEVRLEPGSLRVQDSGIGIPPEDLSHIFERRYRGAQSHGLGLGLYLVKRICDRLGWTVRTSSEPGAGASFELLFPDLLTRASQVR